MAAYLDKLQQLGNAVKPASATGNAVALVPAISALLAQPWGWPVLLFTLGGVGAWQIVESAARREAERDRTKQMDILCGMARNALGPETLDDPEALDRALDDIDDERKPFAILLKVLTAREDEAALRHVEMLDLLERRLPAFIQSRFHELAGSLQAVDEKVTDIATVGRETAAAVREIEQTIDRDHTPFLVTPLEDTPPDRGAVESALSRFVFQRRMTPLFGRDGELDRLRKFLLEADGDKEKFCWWIWSGPAGAGKSRLALELVLEMQYRGWRAGFLPRHECGFDWARWQPAEPTLVVIDYAAERTGVADWLVALRRNTASFTRWVRFLLLERTAEPDDLWLQEFHRTGGNRDKDARLACQFEQPHALAPLADDDLWATVKYVVGELKPDMDITAARDPVLAMLRQAHGNERQNYQRPLYAAFAAETIVAEGVENPRRWRADDLTESVLKREMDRWRRHKLDAQHANLIALATLLRGISTDALDKLADDGELHDILPARAQYHPGLYRTALGTEGAADSRIAALEPDMLGELFVLERLSGRSLHDRDAALVSKETRKLLLAAWRLDPLAMARFMARAGSDFPDYGAADRDDTRSLKSQALLTLCAPPDTRDVALAAWSAAAADLTAMLGEASQYDRAIELANSVCEPKRAGAIPAPARGLALLNRGASYGQLQPPQTDDAIADFTAVIDMPDAHAEWKAMALVNRGVTYGRLEPPQTDREIADYTSVIAMPDAPAEQKAKALFNRGVMYGQLQPPQADRKIADYTAVIAMPDAPAERKAAALVNRGLTYSQLQPPQTDREIADYTAVIDMPDAPAEPKANALLNRGVTYGRLQPPQTDKAIADFTAVIDMPDAPAEQKAEALVNRGVAYGRLQPPRTDKAIADYTAVIDMRDAPAEQKAKALLYRGVTYAQDGRLDEARRDADAAERMADALDEEGRAVLRKLRELLDRNAGRNR